MLIASACLPGCRQTAQPHDRAKVTTSSAATPIAARLAAADPARGAVLFRQCEACHTIGVDGPDTDGPNLYDVLDHPVAERRARYGYTAALRNVGGLWTVERMDMWLTDPARFAPGTLMGFSGLADPAKRADVIAYLRAQSPRHR